MTNEQIEERLGEMQDKIDAYTKRIQSLEEDLKVVIRCSAGNILEQARQNLHGSAPFANASS
jgi:hypothetical protein